MTQPILLLIAYHFPPENAIGGKRPYHFFRFLPEFGCRCHVITAADQGVLQHPDIEDIPDPFSLLNRRSIGWQFERAIRRFLFPAVQGIRWSWSAYRAAERFIKAHPDSQITVLSTYPPLGAHLAGWLTARNLKVKWIADYRDPMPHRFKEGHFSGLTRAAYARLERLFMARADQIIANTDTLQAQFKTELPAKADRIHLIWNGFDPCEKIDPLPIPERPYKLYCHTGALYLGRNISRLLESIQRLIRTGQPASSSLRLRFVGEAQPDCLPSEDFVRGAQKEGWLELIPQQVSQQEATGMAQTSDGLILIQPQSSVQIPGKLFEYLQIGRPILAFVPRNSVIENLLQNTEVAFRCVYTDSSNEEFDRIVADFLSLDSEPRPAGSWFDATFDARSRTRTLSHLIDSNSRQSAV